MFEIRCDGQAFNPCKNMSGHEADAAFRMYTGPGASKGHSFQLMNNGIEIDRRDIQKGK